MESLQIHLSLWNLLRGMNMSETLVILGAGGHAKVCYEIAIEMNQWKEIIVLDDNPENDFFEISGKLKDVDNYPSADFFVAIGSNESRKKLVLEILNKKYSVVNLIHPSSIISSSINIGKGIVIMAGVVINADTKIHDGVILNTSSTVDHDCIIESFVHISPGVHIAGTVHIGNSTWIGIGSSVINDITIETNCIVGAGSIVVKNLKQSGKYFGVPAKLINGR